ncbi:3-dehydroquinate synthase [Sulfidibacter corallicola]|uniref:3-dehydroquinate synthase n=1 Tax=Sulfidibacter corallicola TaxID=2818388 RepID=A0A8A4U2L0_SULCO|nr:3-dehydroquinate synthase family protein [Sulfidibacter corallicola]QTD52965.1 3-dehydroquinate synthase [Sulfidibacter corallicola]
MILQQFHVNQSCISFGHACFAEALTATPLDAYSTVFAVSQANIWDFHGQALRAVLPPAFQDRHLYLMPDGEATKNLETFGKLMEWLADHKADRHSLLLVLGGGVVGDLSGFVASCYMRGMDWIYVPTTLLAQQDASIGGKTAVNLPHGKNLVGHFWEPRAVIIDSSVLSTLPIRQIHAGYMEFLKHGMLDGPELLAKAMDLPVQPERWQDHMAVLAEGVAVKARIVREDPLERGKRRLLNLGHTLGHALESYTRYQCFLHGEAVGIGLLFAVLLGRRLGGRHEWRGLAETVRTRLPGFDPRAWDREAVLDLTLIDKKGVAGQIPWIVPFAPGEIEIVKGVDRQHLVSAYDELVELLS